MSRHTKGPWYDEPFGAVRNIRGADKSLIAQVALPFKASAAQAQADSRLIATVPELFDDLIEAAATLRRYETLHRAKNTEESTAKAEVNAALAARFEATIAKAKGLAK